MKINIPHFIVKEKEDNFSIHLVDLFVDEEKSVWARAPCAVSLLFERLITESLKKTRERLGFKFK